MIEVGRQILVNFHEIALWIILNPLFLVLRGQFELEIIGNNYDRNASLFGQ